MVCQCGGLSLLWCFFRAVSCEICYRKMKTDAAMKFTFERLSRCKRKLGVKRLGVEVILGVKTSGSIFMDVSFLSCLAIMHGYLWA